MGEDAQNSFHFCSHFLCMQFILPLHTQLYSRPRATRQIWHDKKAVRMWHFLSCAAVSYLPSQFAQIIMLGSHFCPEIAVLWLLEWWAEEEGARQTFLCQKIGWHCVEWKAPCWDSFYVIQKEIVWMLLVELLVELFSTTVLEVWWIAALPMDFFLRASPKWLNNNPLFSGKYSKEGI